MVFLFLRFHRHLADKKYYMKIAKRILKVMALLAVGLLMAIVFIIFMDAQSVSYLAIGNEDATDNDSWIMINANIIPMDRDTVLHKILKSERFSN